MENLFKQITIQEVFTKAPRSERAELLGFFIEEINKEREAMGWKYKVGDRWKKLKPITGKAVAVKLGHVKDLETLRYFLSECKDYKHRHGSFSKRFFGGLKI